MKQTAWFALWIVILDQFTKWLILGDMLPGESVNVVGDVIRLTYVRNSAAVMGIDLVRGRALFMLSLPALALLLWFWYRSQDQFPSLRWLLAGITGGAVGNLIDRLWHGWVVDFIDVDIPNINLPQFQLLSWHFPGFQIERWWVFNVADSCIFIGIILLFFISLRDDRATGSHRNVH